MIKPTGSLSLRDLAREKLGYPFPDANGDPMPNLIISLEDLVYGGNLNGSSIAFEPTNTNSPDHPDIISPHSIQEWYRYDHTWTEPPHTSFDVVLFYTTIGNSAACQQNLGEFITVKLDAPSLSAATIVINGSIGYYSDSLGGIVRYYPGYPSLLTDAFYCTEN